MPLARARRRRTPGSAIVCYTLQIYFDFSGYSDMAIGLGRMFGFRFPENFRWPYIADSVQEFWRRWHISLSTWFRDYLYIPLGGNRVSAGAALSQPGHGVLPVRPVARRELELRDLGPVARHRSWSSNASRPRDADSQTHLSTSLDSGILAWPIWPHLYTLAGRDDRLGVLPRRHAAGRDRVSAGDGRRRRRRRRRPTRVRWYLTPELWLALAAGVDRIDAVGGRARAAAGATPSRAPLRLARVARRAPRRLPALLVASIMQIAARTYNPFIYFRF